MYSHLLGLQKNSLFKFPWSVINTHTHTHIHTQAVQTEFEMNFIKNS